ncbi:MAG: 30S ribosomal protein S12 methylthiotransferase RimO [Nautiliaceae bacterium]
MKKLYLASLGCAKNLVDSEVMLAKLKEYKITQNPNEADLIIVNTCGFIDAAKEESIDTILSLANEKKENTQLVVTGCLSARYKEALVKEIPEVDKWCGVGEYGKIDKVIKSPKKTFFTNKVFLIHNEERIITGSNYHAYIKLSEGCNQKCAFCAIPSFKGKLQSRDIKEVIDEIKRLKAKGFKDFSLISQDSSSYLRDKGIRDGLERLIDEIDKIDGISAKILYLYPATTTKRLIRKIFSSKNVVNYFDMPIQHISQRMLKIMKRPSSQKKIKELLTEMRKEFSFVRTSVIVGHPGERDEDFEELKEFLKEYQFDRVNVFAYSDEEGTAAYKRKDKIPPEIIEKRLKEIEKIVKQTTINSLKKYLNKECEGFLEGMVDGLFYAVRPKLWAYEIDGDVLINESEIEDLKVGELYKIKISQLAGDELIGRIIK